MPTVDKQFLTAASAQSLSMNDPQLLSIHNLVFVEKNPPGKRADEGRNAWIRNIVGNGFQVQGEDDLFRHTEFYEMQTLTLWQDNGHVTIFLVHRCCQFIMQAKDTTTDRQRKEQCNKKLSLSTNFSSCHKIGHLTGTKENIQC